MNETLIPAEKVNVVAEADICVLGGSCSGVFAAIRAARLGAKVVLVERQNRFGGVATTGLVGMWHSLFNTEGDRQIIGGLTFETMERLEKRGAIGPFRAPVSGIRFNSEELTLELDEMVVELSGIRVFLQTAYSRPIMGDDGTIKAVVIENKSGRSAIKANVFIDATGDGLLCRDAGFAMRLPAKQQPPTSCARFSNWKHTSGELKELIERNRAHFPALPCGYSWGMDIPGTGAYMLAGTRILHCNCADAGEITRAEVESRRQIRAIMDAIRREKPDDVPALVALPSAIGLRESYHIQSIKPLTGKALLSPKPVPDAIANGTYPVDIHGDEDDTITFKYLNGDLRVMKSHKTIRHERWLPEGHILSCYKIPLGCLIPENAGNLIAAGRMLDADAEAFGAVRVMVNLNQCAEAAGVAAWQALTSGEPIAETDANVTRELLVRGGSIIL